MFKLIRTVLLGRSWWLILGIGLFSAITSGSVIWRLQTLRWEGKVQTVQLAFDTYKLSVQRDVIDTNAKSLELSQLALKNIQEIFSNEQMIKNKQAIISTELIKGLRANEGKSCPVSTAILDYANKLRAFQTNRPPD